MAELRDLTAPRVNTRLACVTYTARASDDLSWWGLATLLGTNPMELMRANPNLATDAVAPGQRLFVPPCVGGVVICPPGTGGPSCAACDVGSYSAGGTKTTPTPACSRCPWFTTTAAVGAISNSSCIREWSSPWAGIAFASHTKIAFCLASPGQANLPSANFECKQQTHTHSPPPLARSLFPNTHTLLHTYSGARGPSCSHH